VDIRLLGAVTACRSGRPVELGPRRQRFLLAVLALEVNQPVPIERLIELAWGTAVPRTAEHAIEVCLSRLRSVLTEAQLQRAGRAYVLNTEPECIDVHRFQRRLREAGAGDDAQRVALLTEALDLWSGPPLAGTAPPDVADRLCRGLTDARWGAIEDRLDARLRLGQHGDVLGELADLTQANPGRERLVVQYATALYRVGRAADALAVCRAHRAWLGVELGLDPGASAQRLELAILRNDPALTPPDPRPASRPVPRELPPDLPVFAGRRAELVRLDAFLERPAPATIVAFSGTAGVGKSTLALHWAHRIARRFPDGQLYINLRGFGGGPMVTAAAALRQFIAALGVPAAQIPHAADARAALFRSLLAGQRMLVVLDNARDAAHVRPLLPGTAGSIALITSRTNLVGLVAGEGAEHVTLDVLGTDEAREFLSARVGAEVVARQAEPADEIIARCARLPLALAVASARMRNGLAELAADLRVSAGALDTLNLPETSVRAVLAWSYHVLSDRTARMFRLIGGYPGLEITEYAAASMAMVDPVQARACLHELVDANLLTEHRSGRYTCHDLLRAYAAECAAIDGPADRQAAAERAIDHCVQSAYACDRIVYPARPNIAFPEPLPGVVVPPLPDETAAWAWLVAERDNLRVAQAFAVERGWRLAVWRLAWATSTLHQRRGHPQDLYQSWRPALAALSEADPTPTRVLALRHLGEACARMERFGEAMEHLHEAARLADGCPAEKAGVLRTLARTYSRRGDDRAAYHHAARALSLYKKLGEPDLVPSAANAAGWYAARLGEFERAEADLGYALKTAREQGDRLVESHTLHSQAFLAQRRSHHEEAVGLLRECLELARSNGDSYHEATALNDLGDSYAALGLPGLATKVWRLALPLLRSQSRVAEAERLREKLTA
jgi:DNA-binding SARP family transcriptional activator/tetratricopeptide (TPR) repeat protein